MDYTGNIAQKAKKEGVVRELDGLVSESHYPFDLHQDTTLGCHIQQRALWGLNWFYREYPDHEIHPEVTQCVCGSTDFVSRPAKHHPRFARIHTMSFINDSNFRIMRKTCCCCSKVFEFDGRSVGLINRNYMIFPVETMYELLQSKVSSGVPTYAWWSNRIYASMLGNGQSAEIRHEQRQKMLRYAGIVNQVFVEFCGLLDIPDSLFHCCDAPDVICVDGIVLSIETNRINEAKLKQPWKKPQTSVWRATDRPVSD